MVLKNWDVRAEEKGQDLRSLYERFNGMLEGVEDAATFVLIPPPIQGIGNASWLHHADRAAQRRLRLPPAGEPRPDDRRRRERAIRAAEAQHLVPGRRAADRDRGGPGQGRGARR
ncbi:hypothetical protein ACU4GR_25735 [Methylobacterium oryzae CBMB20]